MKVFKPFGWVLSLIWALAALILAITAFYWVGPSHWVKPVDRYFIESPATVEQKAEYQYAASFVVHTTILSNKMVDAGEKAKWLSLCAFVNSKHAEAIPYRRNFRLAYTLVPAWEKPYKRSDLSASWVPYYDVDVVMDEVRDGHILREYLRVRDELVIPFMKGGPNYEVVPAEWRDSCKRVKKLTRSYLGGLKTYYGWPDIPEIQTRMQELGYEVETRVESKVEGFADFAFFAPK